MLCGRGVGRISNSLSVGRNLIVDRLNPQATPVIQFRLLRVVGQEESIRTRHPWSRPAMIEHGELQAQSEVLRRHL
jgi:hypothetical protein